MACYVRTGHHSRDAGEWRDGKGLVATSWLHTISRDGDPQLHVHLAVLNAVQRTDGVDDKWRAADGQHFYQLRHLYGVTVDRAFEQRLLAMGYAMTGRADGNGAEVGGVAEQVIDRFPPGPGRSTAGSAPGSTSTRPGTGSAEQADGLPDGPADRQGHPAA
jgi:conjugative relaxase-like TrwC/TraI family protein